MDSRMKRWQMCRVMGTALVIAGLAVPSPVAWAQLQEADPALHAAVEALIAHDPEVAGDPELAVLCRQVAEATLVDPRERAAVTREVVTLRQEGVDINTVIPQEVRTAARDQWEKVQGEMKQQLETLRATDPEGAKEMELMMREGERQMEAFSRGERYVPSPEMVEHAKDMFSDWKETMLAQGASPEMMARAEMEFTRWSSGDMMMGGPGHEMGPGGPGQEGTMPSLEQMQAMVDAGQMTQEQLQMAKEYLAYGGPEHFGPGSFEGSYMPEGWARDQTGEFHYVAMEGMTPEQYREQFEAAYRPENVNYDNLQQQHFDITQPPPAEYKIREDAHVADHNGDLIPETHMHEIFRHTQGTGDLTDDTCHDHAAGGTAGC